jgi:hypothetical protein
MSVIFKAPPPYQRDVPSVNAFGSQVRGYSPASGAYLSTIQAGKCPNSLFEAATLILIFHLLLLASVAVALQVKVNARDQRIRLVW